ADHAEVLVLADVADVAIETGSELHVPALRLSPAQKGAVVLALQVEVVNLVEGLDVELDAAGRDRRLVEIEREVPHVDVDRRRRRRARLAAAATAAGGRPAGRRRGGRRLDRRHADRELARHAELRMTGDRADE